MKAVFFLTSLLFTSHSFGETILCDRGDEWFQVLHSPGEVIACSWVGYRLCYEGKAVDAVENFRAGQEMSVEHVGLVKILTASVRRNKIEVTFDVKGDGLNSLSVSRCKP